MRFRRTLFVEEKLLNARNRTSTVHLRRPWGGSSSNSSTSTVHSTDRQLTTAETSSSAVINPTSRQLRFRNEILLFFFIKLENQPATRYQLDLDALSRSHLYPPNDFDFRLSSDQAQRGSSKREGYPAPADTDPNFSITLLLLSLYPPIHRLS